MGLLITLYLIAKNRYDTLEAPHTRGFSYIEIWMFGVESIILIAIFEYSLILVWERYCTIRGQISQDGHFQNKTKEAWSELKEKADQKIIFIVDMIMFSVSIILFVCFNLFYWFWS